MKNSFYFRKILASLLALTLLGLALSACGTSPTTEEGTENTSDTVIITVKDYGTITVELYPDVAPITVANFKKLVAQKYYDGTTFHRVINNFMIQGGAGASTGNIKGEFAANGVSNSLSHTRGVISMARANAYNSASSQFFICHGNPTYLDGQYAAFGKVTEGMDVVDAIAGVSTDSNDKPLSDVVIESVRFV